ncbi:MAG: serine hydrolase [Acidothermales bacterium]|nr:serine hydrolase [Acidothermales bacterium]
MAAASATAVVLLAAAPAAADDHTGPPTVTADDVQFTPGTQLRAGTAQQAGLVPQYVDRLRGTIAQHLQPEPTHPEYAGAVELVARDGVIASNEAVGKALQYSGYDATTRQATELPADQQIPMRPDTIFDLASMSKLFTSMAAVQLIQQGRIDLNAPVAKYVPAFAQNGKGDITVRNVLTHTAGLPPDPSPSLCTYADNDQRWAAVNAIKPTAPPGTTYVYSDVSMMATQEVIEAVTGKTLDAVVRDQITAPLGLHDTMYNPPRSLWPRIAATEYQPWTGRTMIQGTVHDENAYCLGGVAGHAGVFSTAHDIAVLAQTILNGGTYGNARIMSPDYVRLLMTNYNQDFPGDSHGLGYELDQRWYMDGLSSPVTMGHTGYTGTSIVIDPLSHSFVILLTNRVHPTRDWISSNNPSRRDVARDLALAVPVKPAEGGQAWFSGTGDRRTATLGLPLSVPATGGRVSFDLWYDTEEGFDIGSLQASTDGGATWSNVPMQLRSGANSWSSDGTFSGFDAKRWSSVSANLPGGVTNLRWRYTTDSLYEGRGVYVDGVRAWDSAGNLLFDESRGGAEAAFQADGWSLSST